MSLKPLLCCTIKQIITLFKVFVLLPCVDYQARHTQISRQVVQCLTQRQQWKQKPPLKTCSVCSKHNIAKESFVATPTSNAIRNRKLLNALKSYLYLFYQLIMTHYTDTSSPSCWEFPRELIVLYMHVTMKRLGQVIIFCQVNNAPEKLKLSIWATWQLTLDLNDRS